LFFLLAGASAYLSHNSGKSIAEISSFLWKRGLWLVFLEVAILGFFWSFIPGFSFGGVIWALGWSMILLSLLVRIPLRWVVGFSLTMILFHHLLDSVTPADLGSFSWLWMVLHVNGVIDLPALGHRFYILYPLVPSVGVMAVGFALGTILVRPSEQRKRWLVISGIACTALFAVLRAANLYGFDENVAVLFTPYESFTKTAIAFLNTQKYPFSLQFLLMTIGPGLLFLAWFEGKDLNRSANRSWNKIRVFGQVPMFYYLLHIPLIHILAVLVAIIWQQPVERLIGTPLPFSKPTPGYGHGLPFIYFMTVVANILLAPPCTVHFSAHRSHACQGQPRRFG
jgi:uncharacterized membrane protein